MLIKNKTFWIVTGIFLVVSLAMIWYLYPPLLSNYKDQKSQLKKLDTDIANQQNFLSNINQLKTQEAELTDTYNLLNRALPVSNSPEILLLELDGLVKQLGISDAKLTVPFDQPVTSTSSSGSSTSSNTSSGDVKPSSQGSTAPTIVSGEKAKTEIKISGSFDYNKTKELIVALRSFVRWNKITSVTIASSDGKFTSTITAQVFTKTAPNSSVYSGSNKFLESAKALVSSLKTFTTIPDATTEGNFGRSDPFQTAK